MAKFRIFKRGEEWTLYDGRRVRILRFVNEIHGDRYWWVRALDEPFGVPRNGRAQWCRLMTERALLRVSRGPKFTSFMNRVIEPGVLIIPALGSNPIDVRRMAGAIAASPLDRDDRVALRNMYWRLDSDLMRIEVELALMQGRRLDDGA